MEFKEQNGEIQIHEVKRPPVVFPECETADRLFALLYFLVGYGFIFVVSSRYFESYLAIFTLCYGAVVLSYLYLKGKAETLSKESWFWFLVMLSMGLPYAFYSVWGILQVLALMMVAAYWTLLTTDRLLKCNRTSEWVFFDVWNAMVVVPFCNFGCQVRVLFRRAEEKEGEKEKGKIGAVLLGLVLVFPVLMIVLPLLSSADAGFEHLVGNLLQYIGDHLMLVFLRILFAIPVSFYLFGLVFGGVHGRNTERIKVSSLMKTKRQMRVVADTTVCTALLVLCFVYLLFIGLQGSYLFSAFAGGLPEEFTYAEYARRGFFELCQIGVWNLVLLWSAGAFAKSGEEKHRGLEGLKVLLSVLTLLLLMTAISKMGMYMSVYGLTVRRILPLVLMLWMVLVFVSVLVRQKKEFEVVRVCVLAGAVMFCLLCVCPVEKWVEVYNVWARARGLIV